MIYELPQSQIALTPSRPSRVLLGGSIPAEIPFSRVFDLFDPGDILVINETKVLPRRVKSLDPELEILFLNSAEDTWEVLMPSASLKLGSTILLPGGVQAELVSKGRPQQIKLNQKMDAHYFEEFGQLPIPPYIKSLREYSDQDRQWYQPAQAQVPGSLAAPTASLHFSAEDFLKFQAAGIEIAKVVLHVGLGTFLPPTEENFRVGELHEEFYEVPRQVWENLARAKGQGKRIIALGTTAARAIESRALANCTEEFQRTKLFIRPGFRWQVISDLMTNFHQPKSSLLDLLCAFSDEESVKVSYQYALKNNFKFLSYGDLSIWSR
jgi:S-adenosylmethionine:tRNA ribosyltransferase-isomerase